MLQLKRVSHKFGRQTAVFTRRYFFPKQATNKKSFKIHKMILLVLVVSLFLPLRAFAAAPVFTEDGPFSITENSSTGTFVGQVVATGATSFAITAGNGTGGGAFSIDNGGIIRVADGTQLDYETTPQFSLTVEATNTDGTTPTTVIINIQNVNDPPQMDQSFYEFSIDENLPNTSLVGTVSATDNDPGDIVVYSLVPGPITAFAIDSDDGEIRIVDTSQIDFELGPTMYTIYVLASDGGLIDIAPVLITIDDANDAPVAVDDGPYNATEDTQLNVNLANGVLANDTDQDQNPADTLTAVLDTQPTNGTVNLNSDGSFSYMPDPQFDGTDSFTYHANDGEDDSKIATVTINVVGTNDAPIANNDTYSTDEDTVLNVPADGVLGNDTDPENDSLTVSTHDATSTMGAAVSVNADGSFSYDPTGSATIQALDAGDTDTDAFTYTISDGELGDTATVTIDLDGLNDAPVATDDGTYNATEDTDLIINLAANGVLANDTDVDADDVGNLTAILNAQATNGSVVLNSDGTFTYTPDPNYNGPDSFTYFANDGTVNSDSAIVTINVASDNDAPVIIEGATIGVTMSEDGSPTAFSLTLNATDAEDDTLTWSISSPAARGTASASGTGNSQVVGYIPNPNYSGLDSFEVQVSDGNGGFDTITVNVTITPVNDPPVANDDSDINWATDEDNALSVTPASVLDNDTDPENDGLTVSTADAASAMGAAVTVNPDGTFSYDPTVMGASAIQALDAGDSDTDTFSYTASDGNGGTDTATVTIDLTGVNDTPVAVTDSYNATEDTNLVINVAAGVLDNDTDVDADDANTLTAVLDTTTSNGTLTLNPDGSFSYMPNAEYSGPDSFTYHANDGDVDSNIVTVTINVAAANDAPVANDDSDISWATDEDNALTVVAPGVLANDTDQENDTLFVSTADTTSAMGAAVSVNADGSFSYDPRLANAIQALDAGDSDTDTFGYTVADGNGGTDTATVTIALTGVNDIPVAVTDSYNATEDTNLNINATIGVLANDTDVDADDMRNLTAILDTTTSNGTLTLNPDGSFTYVPNAEYSGPDSFTYHANDGVADSNTVTVNITVFADNDVPTITQGDSTSVTMSEDGNPTAFSLTLNATDPDGNTLTWSIQSQAGHGTATATGTGTSKVINYTPTTNYNGSDSFVVQVSDGFGGSDTITVNMTITPVNDAPNAVNDSASTQPDTAVVINVLNNDTDVENDGLTVTAVTQGSKGSVSHNGTTVTYTPNPNESGNDTFTYTISDGNGGSDTATVTVQLGNYEIFLPMIVNNFVSAPDLVVSNINASSDLIEMTIENQGTQATSSGFWVDFYIDPDPVPTHENELWADVATEGIAWGVTVSIPAGGSLTLQYSTAPGAANLYYSAEDSNYSGSLPVGTPVYAQVDSAHLNTTYGGVLETHEILGEAYNNVSSEYTAVATATSIVSVGLAARYNDTQPLALPLR
ncbi:MAG: hypothetical protein CL608_17415 [Anaerolineaceae bacterium]|nr:hypothetical protein [Anaerolineaceae bacterium]